MNHSALFLKLIKRKSPINVLRIIEYWFSNSFTCVRWGSQYSQSYKQLTGVRQGGSLSPYLFAIFIDDIAKHVSVTGKGCHFGFTCLSIILYADDIILLAPSVTELQSLLDTCDDELYYLYMFINSSKSKCIRFGPRYKNTCANITTRDGKINEWVESCRYLCLFFISGPKLKTSNDNAKAK